MMMQVMRMQMKLIKVYATSNSSFVVIDKERSDLYNSSNKHVVSGLVVRHLGTSCLFALIGSAVRRSLTLFYLLYIFILFTVRLRLTNRIIKANRIISLHSPRATLVVCSRLNA